MPVTAIVGGQFGSEGKGKVAHYVAGEVKATVAVRVGGSNSGHTIIDSTGTPVVFRQLPTSALLPDVVCILPAGSYLDVDVLIAEIKRANLSSGRLLIDPNAVIITGRERSQEQYRKLRALIGSTTSGTGAAVQRRIERDGTVHFAKQEPLLGEFIGPTVPFMRAQLAEGNRIVIEGTQGFGLSVLHSSHYPYVTSRDTTAAAFVSEAGLSPLDVDDVVMVLRAFPIRVGGNSGPLPNEIDWQTVSSEAGAYAPIIEYTSVTHRVRRVARFHPDVVRQAIRVNRPTRIVLNHLDYIDTSCYDADILPDKVIRFVHEVESNIDWPIDYFGVSPSSLLTRDQAISDGRGPNAYSARRTSPELICAD